MCRRVTCSTCGKPDWAGCGAHIESVLGDVKPENRCQCREDGTRVKAAPGGLLSALFGRR
ncbi:MAG: hypothetical protein R3F61_02205 [Myxococcota bacterium]